MNQPRTLQERLRNLAKQRIAEWRVQYVNSDMRAEDLTEWEAAAALDTRDQLLAEAVRALDMLLANIEGWQELDDIPCAAGNHMAISEARAVLAKLRKV